MGCEGVKEAFSIWQLELKNNHMSWQKVGQESNMAVTLKTFKASNGMNRSQTNSLRPAAEIDMAKKPPQKQNMFVHHIA